MSLCKFISITRSLPISGLGLAEGDDRVSSLTAEELIVYLARVSSPSNQGNLETASKLLAYLIKHKHWSPFEMVDMTVEIETSRAIAAQILRHRSFSFQEFSQRYAKVGNDGCLTYQARRQAEKNRQQSVDDLPSDIQEWFRRAQQETWDKSYDLYEEAIQKGVAKECARFLLPLNTKTKLYMKGSCRSWIHYLQVRDADGVQPEHRDIAADIKDNIFSKQFPNTSEAMEWR